MQILTILIEDGNGDGTIDWQDADKYSRDYDGDGADSPDPIPFPVIADYDRILWQTYRQPCDPPEAPCTDCWVTPQHQVLNQGLVTVEDNCSMDATNCTGCGWGSSTEEELRAFLENILPPAWCGEATP